MEMVEKNSPARKTDKASHFIHAWRKYRRLTQEQLAERIDMTSGAISQLENGIINYTQPTLEAIADALGCQPGDLLSRMPDQQPKTPEAQLRSAMLAFGVDAEDLGRAVSAVKVFVDDLGEQSEQDLPRDQSSPASRRRERVPTR